MGIDQIIKDSGLSQAEIARRAGLSVGCIGDLKSGRRHLTLETALLLQPVLGREDLVTMAVEAAKQKAAA